MDVDVAVNGGHGGEGAVRGRGAAAAAGVNAGEGGVTAGAGGSSDGELKEQAAATTGTKTE